MQRWCFRFKGIFCSNRLDNVDIYFDYEVAEVLPIS